MKIETQGQGIELLNRALPYSNQMKDIDLKHPNAIYFTWRSGRWKLDLSCGQVDRVDGGCLIGDDTAMLMSELVKRELVIKELAK